MATTLETLSDMIAQEKFVEIDIRKAIDDCDPDAILKCSEKTHLNVLHMMIDGFRRDLLCVVFYLNLWPVLRDCNAGIDSKYFNVETREILTKIRPKAKGPPVIETFTYFDELDTCMTELTKACLAGNVEDVKAMLHKLNEGDLSYKDLYGFNCFPYAAAGGHLEICKMLLDRGVDPCTRNDVDETALHLAAKLGRVEVISFLIGRCQLDPFAGHIAFDGMPNGLSPMGYIARNGDVESMKILVKNEIPPKDDCVTFAARSDRLAMVLYLLDECGLSLSGDDGRDSWGMTALLSAVRHHGSLELITELLERGADITEVDNVQRNCFHLAAYHRTDTDRLMSVLLSQSPKCLPGLLSQRDKFEGRELCTLVRGRDRGRPAWHYVDIHRYAMHMFRVQLAKGTIDVKHFGALVKSGFGTFPPREDRREMVMRLRDRVLATDEDPDMTPLHLAVLTENNEMVKQMVKVMSDLGLSLNVRDKFGLTPTHLAAMRGNIEVVRMLVDGVGDGDVSVHSVPLAPIYDEDGQSSADVAQYNGHYDVENYLRAKEYIGVIKQVRNVLKMHNDTEFSDDKLEELRQIGKDLRAYAVRVLRDMAIDINEALLGLGTGPVMEETQRP